MPIPDDPPDLRLRAGEPVVVVDRPTRAAWGLDHWVDGTMGLLRRGDRTTVLSPNGASMARLELVGDRWASAEVATAEIRERREDVDHISGGPSLRHPDTGAVLVVYHAERFADGDPTAYYSFLGLAVSHDDAVTFVDLGAIVRSPVDELAPDGPRPVELGPGSLVVHGEWLHVYFQDRGNGPVRRRLGVARARLDDVWAAASAGRAPVLHTYHDGRWDEPALGGRSSELLPVPWVVWFDVATYEPLDCHLLVYSSSWLAGRTPQWMYYSSVSRDGLRWSPPRPVLDVPLADEIIYLTIDSGGADQRRITGDRLHLYRTRSTTAYRWDDAVLERLDVRCEVVEP